MASSDEFQTRLEKLDSEFAEIIRRIPKRGSQEPAPFWLHFEMIERYKVLREANIEAGMNILEIGCGAHAITTTVLAHLVGDQGRVVTVDIGRWRFVEEILIQAGMKQRVIPLSHDATKLPLQYECFNLAVVVHGIRSFRNESTITQILKEMLRLSPRIFIAESLPIAKTKAQKAHLEMYNLREEIFQARTGEKDDIHYLPLEKLTKLVESAGGEVTDSMIMEIDQPHFLACVPRVIVGKIEDEKIRENLLQRWNAAYEKLQQHGEEHLPVGIVKARRK